MFVRCVAARVSPQEKDLIDDKLDILRPWSVDEVAREWGPLNASWATIVIMDAEDKANSIVEQFVSYCLLDVLAKGRDGFNAAVKISNGLDDIFSQGSRPTDLAAPMVQLSHEMVVVSDTLKLGVDSSPAVLANCAHHQEVKSLFQGSWFARWRLVSEALQEHSAWHQSMSDYLVCRANDTVLAAPMAKLIQVPQERPTVEAVHAGVA